MLNKPLPPAEEKPKKIKGRARSVDAIIAAGGTATGSLLLYMFTQLQQVNQVVNRIDSTQNVLIDEDGLIRPSTTAIRSEIQLQELYSRLDRLERALVNRKN
jgi:hypothetical protein